MNRTSIRVTRYCVACAALFLVASTVHAAPMINAVWKFNEATGSMSVVDSSGNGRDLTVSDDATEPDPNPIAGTFTSGLFGNAFDLTGNPAAGELAISSGLSGGANPITNNSSVTISAWVKPSGPGVIVSELGQQKFNTGFHAESMGINAGGDFRVRLWNLSPVTVGNIGGFGDWEHVVLRYDAGGLPDPVLDGFLNGVESATQTEASRTGPGTTFYGIGARDSTSISGGAFFDGLVDDVTVYSEPLSNTEIKTLFNLGSQLQLDSQTVQDLLELFDAGAGGGRVQTEELIWTFNTGLSGGEGELVAGSGTFEGLPVRFELQLDSAGNGLVALVVPEPGALPLAAFALLGERQMSSYLP